MAVPNPGSSAAVEAGCTCSRETNGWGAGYWRPRNGNPAVFVINFDCPLHWEVITETKEEEPNAR